MKSFTKSILGALALFTAAGVTPSTGEAHSRVSFGVSIGTHLPPGAFRIHAGRDAFYFHRGHYYRFVPRRGYILVPAPRRFFHRHLPRHYTRIIIGGTTYFRDRDIYYRGVPGGYVIVDPPSKPAASAEPTEDGYLPVWLEDHEFLFKDGDFFRRTSKGLVWERPPIGAVATALPDDARSVWYNGVEYFESDGTYFLQTDDGYMVMEKPFPS